VDKYIAKLQKLTGVQRLLVLAGLVALILGANYSLWVGPNETKIDQANAELQKLETSLVQKRAVARDLTRHRVEVERLKQRRNKALAELPDKAEIPELLQKIAGKVEESDCEMTSFTPSAEQVVGFYARIPVKMQMKGNYHSVAVFFDKVAKLERIVNITNIVLKSPTIVNKKVMLTADFEATTFRFVESTSAGKSTGFSGKKK
jgi:type IV pilus assembly protein PilO